eukprot:TRINITY_DN15810_c0_g1_i1.p1 TRINITY_DN15810_c0_g1~~TRINITY_DN15810_c0_g1_i1.p1  ORF type:complete len:454 (+),score=110.30 TRINITY_DN15810_c0_g1_i1:33-1394(+)
MSILGDPVIVNGTALCDGGLLPCSSGVLGSIVLMIFYGMVLGFGSKTIADGSELLMDILDPGFIGGFVLPVLGAVPDTAIILVSCLGPDAQSQLSVGIGTLAGSTIMLLTLPWFAALFVGRQDIENGMAVELKCSKFSSKSWMNQGISTDATVPVAAVIMIATGISYLIVQGPAFAWATAQPDDVQQNLERGFALTAAILSALMFIGYSVYQVYNTRSQSKRQDLAKQRLLVDKVLSRLAKRMDTEARTTTVKSALSKWKKFAVKSPAQPIQVEPTPSADEDDEEEEHSHDPKWKIALKSAAMLTIGTALIAVFSDPMVDTIQAFSEAANLPAFYVAFVVAPFASNASEVISSLIFAAKKKQANLSVTYAQLYGAATMNNTLGLGVFCAMVFFRGLQWSFSAEVISIMLVTVVVGLLGLRQTLRLWMAIPVGLLYPISIALVAFMESGAISWH